MVDSRRPRAHNPFRPRKAQKASATRRIVTGVLGALQEVGAEEASADQAPPPPPLKSSWLLLKGIGGPALADMQVIRSAFDQWGARDIRVLKDPATHQLRGIALVRLNDAHQVHTQHTGLTLRLSFKSCYASTWHNRSCASVLACFLAWHGRIKAQDLLPCCCTNDAATPMMSTLVCCVRAVLASPILSSLGARPFMQSALVWNLLVRSSEVW